MGALSSETSIQILSHSTLPMDTSPILVFYFIVVYYSGSRTGRKSDWAWHIAMILLNPCLILIDHGHFQYNCISLGLTVGAVAAILSDKDLLGCFLFSLALNHKQMSAYFAPAFFSYLLGKGLRCQNPLLKVLKLGLVVIGTFFIVWWPYLQSADAFLQVLSRLAPFERGIYEDYVANFWCTSSILIKWKRLFTIPTLKLLSLGATVSASLPSMVQQIWAPSKQLSLWAAQFFALVLFILIPSPREIYSSATSTSELFGHRRAFPFQVDDALCPALYVPFDMSR